MPRGDVPDGFDPSLPFALVESSRPRDGEAAALLFWAPARALVAKSERDLDATLAAIDGAARAGLFPCGYVAYEAGYFLAGGRAFTLSKAARRELPLVSFHAFARREPLDEDGVDRLLGAIGGDGACAVHDVRLSVDRAGYLADVGRIHGYIRDGDTYQVNYTLEARFSYAGSPAALYRALRRHQEVELGAFLSFPEARVLSLSPELFVRKDGAAIVSKPMKGTAARGATPADDAAIREALRRDPKTLSENVMIADLIRNDLGRLAEPGSVRARDLFEVRTYETVHQMISTIEARVDPALPLEAALRALFPCGSVTGAPKVRTMEIIEALEREPRGVYCGAIGHAAPGGDFALNVAIRTVVSVEDGAGELGIGSGIVAESSPEAELEECLVKARFLTAVNGAFQIIESMRLEAGSPLPERLDAHLARMGASARTFGFAFDEARVAEAVRAAARGLREGSAKVRALLSYDGRVEVSLAPIEGGAGGAPPRVAWSARRVSSRSVFQYHKTTARSLYDGELGRAGGAYDVIFLNERGEVAEASRHNVFVERAGELLTPPVASGLLPGVYRAAVLADPARRARESVLHVADVMSADRVFLSNSVRGMVQVTPLDPGAGAPRGRAERAPGAPRE